MNDNDIIKALECCALNKNCAECPLCRTSREPCRVVLAREAFNLINRLKSEIERLNGCVKSEDEVRKIMKDSLPDVVRGMVSEQITQAHEAGKNEGYIGFAEMVKKNRIRLFNTIYSDYYFGKMIDSFVIEMVAKKAEEKNER